MMSRSYLVQRVALVAGAMLATALPASAQGAGDGFLFREPTVSVGLRGGFGHASAGSDIFAFSTEHLTLSQGDFSGPSLGGDLAFRVHPRLHLALGAGYSSAIRDSEFRDWVGTDDLPIEQTTRFERVPLTAGVKAYLVPPGRTVGRFAWVPSRVAPYVGAGAGAMWYRFRQEGEFMDFETLAIFDDVLESQGWAPMAQGVAGLEYSLTPRLVLSGELKYVWARAELGDSFDEFDPIDLSGAAATFGVNLRF